MDIPFRIYVGSINGSAAACEMLLQGVWVAAILLFARILLSKGLKRVVVQGG